MLQAQLGHLYNYAANLGQGPIAIAYSGGGDSTSLLHMLRDFPSVTHAFIIDHNLREGSAAETARAAEFARRLGYTVEVELWEHGGISSAIQVKAREFRYAAMGALCRARGISHLLTAHTSDDQAETLLMRKARATGWRGLAGMAKAEYGPLWPALAEVTLHRPLLQVRRIALRDYNAAHDLTWTEDPSNENEDFARVRARADLAGEAPLTAKLLEVQKQSRARLTAERNLFGTWLARYAEIHPQGFVTTTRVPPAELLLHLLRAVSGTGGPIDAARREALCAQMREVGFGAATLAGAWVIRTQDGYLFTRDLVAVKGRAGEATPPLCAPMALDVDAPVIWDGRWRLQANVLGVRAYPAYGHLNKFSEIAETQEIFDLPKHVRPTLPVYQHAEQIYGFGAHQTSGIQAENLVAKRLAHKFPKIAD